MSRLSLTALCMLIAATCLAEPNTFGRVNQLEQQGQFKQAADALNSALKESSIAEPDRKRAEFELDRLDRIKKDFPYSKDELFAELKRAVKGLTKKEFEQWIAEGRF